MKACWKAICADALFLDLKEAVFHLNAFYCGAAGKLQSLLLRQEQRRWLLYLYQLLLRLNQLLVQVILLGFVHTFHAGTATTELAGLRGLQIWLEAKLMFALLELDLRGWDVSCYGLFVVVLVCQVYDARRNAVVRALGLLKLRNTHSWRRPMTH